MGEPGHHQAGDGQQGEGRVGEAQAHRHHGQGVYNKEQDGDVRTVISGVQKGCHHVAKCYGALRNKENLIQRIRSILAINSINF